MKKLFRSSLASNFLSLSSIQALNYLIPFITLPYVVRVIGIEEFGLISFAGALTSYFIMITDYGFNLSAVKDISITRDLPMERDRLINSIYMVKLILLALCILIFIPLMFLLASSKKEVIVYSFSFISLLGTVLTPGWYFMGIEKTKYLALITMLFRLLLVICVFAFITEKEDAPLYLLFNSLSTIFIGLLSFVYMAHISSVKFALPSFELIKNQFVSSGVMFISTIGISFYTTTNIFILGLFAPQSIVGAYAASDKVRIALQGIYTPFSQALYPYLSKKFLENNLEAMRIVKSVMLKLGALIFFVSLGVLFWAKEIVVVIFGDGFDHSILLLQIMAFIPFIVFLSNIFGIQILLNTRNQKQFTIVILLGALLNIALNLIFVPKFYAVASAASYFVTELFITLGMLYFAAKYFKIHSANNPKKGY